MTPKVNEASRSASGRTTPARTLGLSPADIIKRWTTEGALERLSTGWETFDAATRGGFVIGRLALLLGAPNAYKTATIACLAQRWLTDGVAIGVLCVDEDADDFMTRLAVMAGVPLDEAEERAPPTLSKIKKLLAHLPLILYDASWTIEAAADDLRRWMTSHGMRRGALLVDSLQTVRSATTATATSLRGVVGGNVCALSNAAARHRLAVIATGEIPRAAYGGGRDDRRPPRRAVRESMQRRSSASFDGRNATTRWCMSASRRSNGV